MSWQGSEHSLVIMGCQRSVHSLVIMSWQRSVHSLVIMSWRGSVHSQGHYELQRAASPDCVQNTQEVKRKMNWSGFKPGSVWWPAKCFTAGPGPFPNQGLCGVWAVNIEFCNQILFSTKNVCLLRFTIAMTFGGGGGKHVFPNLLVFVEFQLFLVVLENTSVTNHYTAASVAHAPLTPRDPWRHPRAKMAATQETSRSTSLRIIADWENKQAPTRREQMFLRPATLTCWDCARLMFTMLQPISQTRPQSNALKGTSPLKAFQCLIQRKICPHIILPSQNVLVFSIEKQTNMFLKNLTLKHFNTSPLKTFQC